MTVRGARRRSNHRIARGGHREVDETQAFQSNAVLQERYRDVITGFVINRALSPFDSRWFAGRSGRTHDIDEDQRPATVFFHRNPTWRFLYRNVIVRLRGQFRCMATD
jgi:hypothetical protein